MEIITPHTLFSYLLEVSICLVVFYLFYVVVLRPQPAFFHNRMYLLLSSLVAVVFPLLEIPLGSTTPDGFSGISPHISVMVLPEVGVGETQQMVTSFSWQQGLLWAYATGVILLLTRFVWQIINIIRIIRQGNIQVSNKGYVVVHTHGMLPVSSFFNYLLWDNQMVLPEADKQRIIAHEEVHMAEGHSYDMMYMSLLKILFWFNPLAYRYVKELTDVHEYAADAKVVEATDTKAYAKILVNQLFQKGAPQGGAFSLLNHFYKSQILKRLKMMELTKSKINRYRILWALPVFALMFFIFSCQEEGDTLAAAEGALVTYENIQEEIQQVNRELNAITQRYPDYKMNFKVTAASPLVEVGYADDYFKAIEGVDNSKDKNTIAQLHYQLHQLQDKLLTHAMPDAEGLYTVVEDQPSPEGGMKDFYEYVSRNIKYPAEARRQDITGRVFVQFVVDTDGSITKVETVKGVGMELDKEAERIVQSAPAWNPGHHQGKAVKVKMILPITFVLDDGKDHAAKSKTAEKLIEEIAAPQMSEIVVVAYKK